MKKLMVLLTLAAVSLGTGCIHYVRGDLGYINEKLDANKEPRQIAYRVNTNFYSKLPPLGNGEAYYSGIGSTLNDVSKPIGDYNPLNIFSGQKGGLAKVEVTLKCGHGDCPGNPWRFKYYQWGAQEKKEINKIVGDIFNGNVLYTEKTLGKKPENLFFDISVMFHEVTDAVEGMKQAMLGGCTLTLWPFRTNRWNVYYSIDIYDKSQVSTPEGADVALGDNRTFKPIARYEYQHVVMSRYTLLASLVIIPHLVGTSGRALNRAITDMTKEFMLDLKDGRKSIVSHNHWRGARGLTLSFEQVGDDKRAEARAMSQMTAAGLQAASGALNTYASMQRGSQPGMSPGSQYVDATSALMRTTKDLGLVAKAATDYRTQKKIQANKNDNMDERLFATDGDPFKYKGGVRLWWYTYKTSTTGDQQFLAYFAGVDVAASNLNMMMRNPSAYAITSKIETQTFGSPSAAVQFIRSKAKQIGDKRFVDIKL
ncbi:MAG TPA: hypothetical protein PKJ16_17640 [Spirochaetota bacterium]|nr:hypothetical protein [Spirochaetota bacterium]HOS39088.1 hypothetical protein [Spirochaetota bacterium]HPU87423.1 hypothetical protein [Spirochaetota bacterium]